MRLEHVLRREGDVKIYLDQNAAEVVKKAARFWIGTAAHKMRKAECIAAIQELFSSRSPDDLISELSDKQQLVLAVFSRYGPVMSRPLLWTELNARGLADEEPESNDLYRAPHRNKIVDDMQAKLILMGGLHNWSYYSTFFRLPELDLSIHPALAKAVTPAAPLSWKTPVPRLSVQAAFHRSSAEVALDLWRVATELRTMGAWKTVKSGALSKAVRNRLRKAVPLSSADEEPLSPPDPESLYYELLSGLGCLDSREEPSRVIEEELGRFLQQPAVVQARHWIRAWMKITLWQDGIGVVPDRDDHYDPVRIDPSGLRKARELLLWALCRVAHGPDEWLDLQTFLQDLWNETRAYAISLDYSDFRWNPGFAAGPRKSSLPAGDQRSFAIWLDDEGVWVANAVNVTLVTLGLVERGFAANKESQPCFRLTELGCVVLGAPESEITDRSGDPRFFTVQPNLEIVTYLDQADAAQLCTLARIVASGATAAGSRASGPVQTFSLTRASVYEALESGMTLSEIETFLKDHSRTAIPANVTRMVSEWAGKRESLVLRTDIALGFGLDPKRGAKYRDLGTGGFVLPNMSGARAAKDLRGWVVLDHQGPLSQRWAAKELGIVRVKGTDSISETRLAQIADHTPEGWRITGPSVTRARQQGLKGEQIIGWLGDHLSHEIPPLLETAVRNWTGRANAFVGTVRLLQIKRAQAREAILTSRAFGPLLEGHIPPDWFVIREEKAEEVNQLLEQLGFATTASYHVSSLRQFRVIDLT